MNRITALLSLLLVASAPTFASPAHAQDDASAETKGKGKGKAKRDDEDKDGPAYKIAHNLKDEAVAIKALAKAVKAEVDAGRLVLTDEAQGRWDRGSEMWKAVLAKVEEKDPKGAYQEVTEARDLMRDTILLAFDKGDTAPASALKDTVKGYFDAVEPRIDAVKRYKDKHELPADAQASYDSGAEKWSEAKAFAKDKKYGKALASVMAGMNELDKVVAWIFHNRK